MSQEQQAIFTSGSTMRHIIIMTATGSAGLVAIFMVDVINLLYIAQLNDQTLTAAVGYGATIMFFSISLSVGLSIATTALAARAIGSGDSERARAIAASSLFFTALVNVVLAVIIFFSLETLLRLLGASGRTFDEALHFIQIVVISSPLMGIAMSLSGLLRAKGDAKQAMYVTLSGGVAAAILDPIFIFGFDLGITGAAIATFLSRVVAVCLGIYGAQIVHKLVGRINREALVRHGRAFAIIAAPAILTQLATPVGNAYVTSAISEFGDDAIAGWTIIGRVMLVAFGTLFALSGSVGPIISQNLGARLFTRINHTLRDALIFTLIYTFVMWALLALFRNQIISMFGATGDAASMVNFFCLFVAASYLFNGALFVANAAFNNLDNPLLATLFNWGRSTIGVIPFVYVGKSFGAIGVLAGWGLGAVVFGIGAALVSFRVVRRLPERFS